MFPIRDKFSSMSLHWESLMEYLKFFNPGICLVACCYIGRVLWSI